MKKYNLKTDIIKFCVIDYNDHDTEAGENYKNIGKIAAKASTWQNE